MRVMLFTLMSVLSTAVMAATVYKWVDENGVTHYSDQPHENAQKVHLGAPQTYTAPRLPAQPPAAKAPAAPEFAYQTCAITAPASDETFMNAYEVTANVLLQPQRRARDQLQLVLDGKPMPIPPSGNVTFAVERGAHTVQAQVLDETGQTVCQSSSITFYVQQPSVLNPVNPNFRG